MRWIYKLSLRLRSLFRKNRVEQELSEELRFHLEKQIEQNIAQGMSPQKARYAALRQFGNVGAIKEECRDSWGICLFKDSFRTSAMASASSVATLALRPWLFSPLPSASERTPPSSLW